MSGAYWNELIEKLSREHGVKFIFDLNDPSEENEWTAGEFHYNDQTIHLIKEPSLHTILHEVGHYLHYKRFNPCWRICLGLNILSGVIGIFAILLNLTFYTKLSFSIVFLTHILTRILERYDMKDSEKIANKYADKEIQKLLDKGVIKFEE